MGSDYGVRAEKRAVPTMGILRVVLILGAVALAGVFWKAELRREAGAVAKAKAWTITGPPCPALDRKAFIASPVKASHPIEYDDVRFDRGFGHVSCDQIAYDGGRDLFSTYPVCQFTSPGMLRITTSGGEFYFLPQNGPATVAVAHGRPTCVMASNFTTEGDFTGG